MAKWQSGKRRSLKRIPSSLWLPGLPLCHFAKREKKGPRRLRRAKDTSPLDAAIAAAVAFAAREPSDDELVAPSDASESSSSSSDSFVDGSGHVEETGVVSNARDDARRKHYLLTWPPTDDPDRRAPTFEPASKVEFTRAVADAYTHVLGSPPARHVTVIERTKKGRPHGHMAVQHTAFHRWKRVADRLRGNGYYVDFRETDTYPRATRYITEASPKKSLADIDPDPLISKGHPPLRGVRRVSDVPPRPDEAEEDTAAASRALKPITPEEFYDLCVDQGLETRADVMRYAQIDRRLVKFVMRQGHRLEDLLSLAAELQRGGAPPPPRPSRLDLLDKAAASACVCGERWLPHAYHILDAQGLRAAFPAAVYRALREGRGKGRNLWLWGDTNRGKSFLLEPLEIVFTVFQNPAEGKFNLEGLVGKDVVLIDDFRTEENLFPWRIQLVWLDGRTFNIPRPRNIATEDTPYAGTAPVFISSKEMPTRRKYGIEDRTETEQLRERFSTFYLHQRIERPPPPDIPPCGRCWAMLVKYTRRNYRANPWLRASVGLCSFSMVLPGCAIFVPFSACLRARVCVRLCARFVSAWVRAPLSCSFRSFVRGRVFYVLIFHCGRFFSAPDNCAPPPPTHHRADTTPAKKNFPQRRAHAPNCNCYSSFVRVTLTYN